MPVLNSVVKVVAKPLPRMISPQAHAIMDYVMVGSFFAGAAFFWRRNKRAALASLLCGGARLAVSLLTDYPGGVRKVIRFHTRREIDLGLAAMTATMPEFLAFKDAPQKNFFVVQGVITTAANELTQFPERHRPGKERGRAA
jgi:hypothetical protein